MAPELRQVPDRNFNTATDTPEPRASRPCVELLEDRCVPSFSQPVEVGGEQPITPGSGGYYPQSMVTADFNGDGRLDLATAIRLEQYDQRGPRQRRRHIPGAPNLHLRLPRVDPGGRPQRRRQGRPGDGQHTGQCRLG